MRTAIILPAHNVEQSVRDTLENLKPYQERVFFVDDGSSDHTREVIRKQGFHCISHVKNQGMSKAILTGMKVAKESLFEAVIILDSDGQHSPKYIPQFERELQYCSVVTGDRFHSFQNLPSNKIASNAMGAAILFDLYQCNIFDTSCGYKGFRLDEELMAVAEASFSYSFVFDILLDALNRGKLISSVKIDCVYPASEFHYTKRAEIISFISSFQRYVMKEQFGKLGLEELQESVNVPVNFVFKIQHLSFYGFYLREYDGYILQTDLVKLEQWVGENIRK